MAGRRKGRKGSKRAREFTRFARNFFPFPSPAMPARQAKPTFKVMVTCGYSSYAGGSCGSSSQNPTNEQCVALGKCQKEGEVNAVFSFFANFSKTLNSEKIEIIFSKVAA